MFVFLLRTTWFSYSDVIIKVFIFLLSRGFIVKQTLLQAVSKGIEIRKKGPRDMNGPREKETWKFARRSTSVTLHSTECSSRGSLNLLSEIFLFPFVSIPFYIRFAASLFFVSIPTRDNS